MEISLIADGYEFVPVERLPVGHSFIAVIEKVADGMVFDPEIEILDEETGELEHPFTVQECVYFLERNPETGEQYHRYYAAKVLKGKIIDGINDGIYQLNKTVLKVVLTGWQWNYKKTYQYSTWQIFRGKK